MEQVCTRPAGRGHSAEYRQAYLNKIQSDYASLIDVFIEHKEDVTSTTIENYIGDAITIA